ncbi:MAG: DUF111 family protein [Actinobacteria bacterium]|nr:DUF111 family protein [Actinomycetota bacterium]
MTTAHLECASGAAGDMWLGAVVDAGASLERIQDAVDRLGMGDVRLTWGRVRRAGTPALSVRVRPPHGTTTPETWPAIRRLLEDAGLPDAVRDRAHAVFRRLAEAEASVAGVPVDGVRFPTVGTLDRLGDVVGTCAGVADLGLRRITVGPIATGSGRVDRPLGAVEVPSPTVVALLRDHRLVATDVASELVTATGAALIAELTEAVQTAPELDVARIGVGAGAADLAHPNVLRLLVGEPAAT